MGCSTSGSHGQRVYSGVSTSPRVHAHSGQRPPYICMPGVHSTDEDNICKRGETNAGCKKQGENQGFKEQLHSAWDSAVLNQAAKASFH